MRLRGLRTDELIHGSCVHSRRAERRHAMVNELIDCVIIAFISTLTDRFSNELFDNLIQSQLLNFRFAVT